MKRNLPSWMSDKDNLNASKSHNDDSENKSGTIKAGKSSAASRDFSKLLDGVVFVLSGFVNPERGTLRSQALEMGAQYQQDWNSDCTLLVCAFPNTPKFQQVQADCGTIVSKEWISECYSQKKLVEIDSYLMHAGKPWRRNNNSAETGEDQRASPHKEPQKEAGGPHSKSTGSASSHAKSKSKNSSPFKERFSPSEVRKWAIDDFNRTISWLNSQEEKPEPSELKNIAVEGILTCIQDTMDSLEKKQGIHSITEQWSSVPLVVEELAKLEKGSALLSADDLYKEAKACKQIYEKELSKLNDVSSVKGKKPRTTESKKCKDESVATNDPEGYDSDATIEMTEEEINLAFNDVKSKLPK